METKQHKDRGFVTQGIILASASIIVRIIGLIYRIPLTNIIGDEGNGFYSCAFEVYNIALLLSSYSLPLAVSKLVSARVAKGERSNAFRVFKGSLTFAIAVGGVIAVLVFLGSDFIASVIMTSPLSAYALRVLAPCLFIVAILGVMRGYCQGIGTTMPTAISQVFEQIINAVVSIVAASYLFKIGLEAAEAQNNELLSYAYGAAGGTLGTVLGAFTGLVFMVFVLWAYLRIIKKQIRRETHVIEEDYSSIFKLLLLTIIPVVMSTAIYNISSVLDQGIFNKIMASQGATQQEYSALWGIFSGKYRVLLNVPLGVSNAFATSVIPSLTIAMASRNRKQVHGKINMAVRISMLIAIPSFIGFFVLASPILQLLFNDASKTPRNVLMLGAISVVFYCLSTISNAVLQGINRMKVPIRNASISLVVHLIALIIMLVVFKWNIYAVVISNIIFSLLMCILNQIEIRKAVKYRQEWRKTFVLPLISACIMGGCSYLVYRLAALVVSVKLATVLGLFIALITYVVSLIVTGALIREDLETMPRGNKIIRLLEKFKLMK